MSTKHPKVKVSLFHWFGGLLHVVEELVESIEHALEFTQEHECHSFKIHNRHGNIVRSGHGCNYHAPNHEESHYC